MQKKMNMVWSVVIVIAFIAALVFISIKDKPKMTTDNLGDNTTNNMNNDNINNDMNTDNAGDTTATNPTATPTQTGQVAKTGDTVAVNYTGRLEDGTVFDSNVDPKFNHVTPFVFTLGAGQVIPGWDKGIVGMKVGETKTLTIPPADAYGATGVPGAIPPNSTLIFNVQLLAIK